MIRALTNRFWICRSCLFTMIVVLRKKVVLIRKFQVRLFSHIFNKNDYYFIQQDYTPWELCWQTLITVFILSYERNFYMLSVTCDSRYIRHHILSNKLHQVNDCIIFAILKILCTSSNKRYNRETFTPTQVLNTHLWPLWIVVSLDEFIENLTSRNLRYGH